MDTSEDTRIEEAFRVGQDSYKWLEAIYGTGLYESPCLQNYGKVETMEGRLLAFPNVLCVHENVYPSDLGRLCDVSNPRL